MNPFRYVALAGLTVNTACMALSYCAGDLKTFAIAYTGATCAAYGALYYTEEDKAMAKQTFHAVAMQIRWEIKTDKLANGDQLPTQRDYARRLNSTRTTVARAMNLLADEGLVQIIHGKGTFVRDPRAPRDSARGNLARPGFVEQTLRESAERYDEIGSPEGIAYDLEVSESTVRRYLRKLVIEGLLRRRADGIYTRA